MLKMYGIKGFRKQKIMLVMELRMIIMARIAYLVSKYQSPVPVQVSTWSLTVSENELLRVTLERQNLSS